MGRRAYTPKLRITFVFLDDEDLAWERIAKVVAIVLAASPSNDEKHNTNNARDGPAA